MKQKLVHLLDTSVCITKRQLKDYIAGTMTSEECHAVEHHVNGCAFCSDAFDGALMHAPADAIAVTTNFNDSFLKAHFSLNDPQVHLNSMGPSMGGKNGKKPFWVKASVAAAVVIGAAIILLLQTGKGAGAFGIKHLSAQKDIKSTQPVAGSTTNKVTVAAK